MINMNDICCRFCSSTNLHSFADLGMSPLANGFLRQQDLLKKEIYYPLHAYVCENCFLVQLSEFEPPQNIFSEYAYFSSYSSSWLEHVKRYTRKMIEEFRIGMNSQVIEIASNDGYLLQYFKKEGIPVLGIEPAKNVAIEAVKKDIPTIVEFFGSQLADTLARENMTADLLIGNNVLAHVPRLNDFTLGMKTILKPRGVITMEFPHLLRMITENQFDTIYHEHFSYLSLLTVKKLFEKHGLCIFDAEEISTHGGSLRIYARHADDVSKPICSRVSKVLNDELNMGLDKIETYMEFSNRIKMIKRNVLEFLIKLKNEGKVLTGYGAPAKGNTLLNYCGIAKDFLDYTTDKNPYKQGLYLPGSHLPVFAPEKIRKTKPDYIVILPWNLKDEIIQQINFVKEWGCRLVTFIPDIEVY